LNISTRRNKVTEQELHFQVADYLRLALPTQTVWHHSPNEGRRRPQYNKKLARLGLRAGWPDIEIVHKGRIIFIELKTPKGRVSPAQKQCHNDLMLAGAVVKICRSFQEVQDFLTMSIGGINGHH
jgi:hypothetical protein